MWGETTLRLYLKLKLSGRPEKRRRMTTTNYNSDGGVFFSWSICDHWPKKQSNLLFSTWFYVCFLLSPAWRHVVSFLQITHSCSEWLWIMLQLMFSHILAPFCLAWMAILYLHIAHQNSITIQSALWKSKGHRLTAKIEFERYKRNF